MAVDIGRFSAQFIIRINRLFLKRKYNEFIYLHLNGMECTHIVWC